MRAARRDSLIGAKQTDYERTLIPALDDGTWLVGPSDSQGSTCHFILLKRSSKRGKESGAVPYEYAVYFRGLYILAKGRCCYQF